MLAPVTCWCTDNGNSEQFMQNRLDGYNDGYGNTFQGVRSQDSNTGQWSTPDAYAGDVSDPMSQKPFMYDGNNPIAYSDPSGYQTIEEDEEEVGGDVGEGYALAELESVSAEM